MYNVGCNTCNHQGVCLLCGIKFREKQAGAISVLGTTTVRYYNVVQLQCTMQYNVVQLRCTMYNAINAFIGVSACPLCCIRFRAKPRDSKVQSKCKSAPGDTLPMQIQMFLQDNPAEPSQSPPPSNVL